ncbi:MAG: AI-2E family transporter [Caldilineales bacterium]|nr:AI-2E family transporter [Caldilineales bacterium]
MADNQFTRFVLILLAVAAVFVIMFGIKATAVILNPILLAMVITITVLPLPGILQKRGLPGWLALAVTVVAVVGALALVIALFFLGISKLTISLPSYANDIAARADSTAQWIESNLAQIDSGSVDSAEIANFVGTLLGFISGSLVTVFMTLLIFIFMLSAAITLPSSTRLGLSADRPALSKISGLTEDVRRYISIMTLINFLVGMGDALLLWIMGVDFALLWGLLAWFLGYIPTIGFWLALIPPTILAWAQYGWNSALIVFIGYVIINGSVQNFVQPKMMGNRLNISPVVVFVSLFVWGWLLGGIGAILAVPLTLLIFSFLDSFEVTRWIVTLLRLGPKDEDKETREARERLRSLWGRVNVFANRAEEGR